MRLMRAANSKIPPLSSSSDLPDGIHITTPLGRLVELLEKVNSVRQARQVPITESPVHAHIDTSYLDLQKK